MEYEQKTGRLRCDIEGEILFLSVFFGETTDKIKVYKCINKIKGNYRSSNVEAFLR